jgi:hypothetical protein
VLPESAAQTAASPRATSPRTHQLLLLVALFLLALLPRLYSAQSVGWNWDYPGSFTLVNFDEAGSCRAALAGFEYSPFVGQQTIGLARLLGIGPSPEIIGDAPRVKAYCHGQGHMLVARSFSAVCGALTVVLTCLIALMLIPSRPEIAWTAGALLALSGFHISQSHMATVDAASVFFIYALLTLMVYAVSYQRRWALWASPLLLVPAVLAKYWVFALLVYLVLVPERVWRYLSHGMSAGRCVLLLLSTAVLLALMTNSDFQQAQYYPLLALWYLVIPWRRIHRPMVVIWLLLPALAYGLCQLPLVAAYTTGGMTSAFGSGYAAIGWHKLLRNLVNVPAVLIVGLGLPACLLLPVGIRALLRGDIAGRAWWCLTPVLAFALFMAFVSPVTYYRHYLPLLPAAAVVAACGLFATNWGRRRWFILLFFVWPLLLAIDLVGDYHRDPRIQLRGWFEQHPRARVLASYYVNPPTQAAGNTRLFAPEDAFGSADGLRRAQYLILSENWYDTAFANELNGPLARDTSRLVKTRPEYARFYREALAAKDPHLQWEQTIPVANFMPELLVHQRLYGTFQLSVGDLQIFRVHGKDE